MIKAKCSEIDIKRKPLISQASIVSFENLILI